MELMIELYKNNVAEESNKDVFFMRRKSLESGSNYIGKPGNKIKRLNYNIDFFDKCYELLVRYQLKKLTRVQDQQNNLSNQRKNTIIIPKFLKN